MLIMARLMARFLTFFVFLTPFILGTSVFRPQKKGALPALVEARQRAGPDQKPFYGVHHVRNEQTL